MTLLKPFVFWWVLPPDMIQDGSLFILRDHMLYFPTKIEFLSLKIVLVSANSVDPDEMPQYAAFLLGLHCLPKYPFRVHTNSNIQI